MGSDLYMNPPKEQFDCYVAKTEDEVMEYVVGALATDRKIIIHKNYQGIWHIFIGTGTWI